MKHPPSLTWRLIRNLFWAQILALTASWVIASMLMLTTASNFSYDYLSMFTVRDMVIESIASDKNGSIHIRPRKALADELIRNPGLKFAVFKALPDEPIPGSSAELSAAIRKISNADTRGMDFFLSNEVGAKIPGSIWQWNTPFGPLFIATSGSEFRWYDLLYYLRNEASLISINLFAMVLFSAFAAWVVVRNGLLSLRSAASAADRIDMDTLGQGIPVEDALAETKPLIDSINKALARLDASAARMRRYMANAAHELRTPVAILRARLENPEEPTFKTDLKRDVRRLQAIVEQMLIATRLNERQAGLDQQVDIVAAARGIVGDYAPLAVKAGMKIEFESSERSLIVRGNQQAIECVIVNLVDNALRAEPKGGIVFVAVESNGTIVVVDHGEGVSPDDCERIFEPFWRKRDATPGAGLGLAISKELVDAHGGRLWVEETPSGGATFKLSFEEKPEQNRTNIDDDAMANVAAVIDLHK